MHTGHNAQILAIYRAHAHIPTDCVNCFDRAQLYDNSIASARLTLLRRLILIFAKIISEHLKISD